MPLYDPRTQKPASLVPGRPYPRFWGPPPDMGFTFGSFGCPSCGKPFSTSNGVTVHCPFCGTQVNQKTEPLETSELSDAIKAAPFGGTTLACPDCSSSCVTDSGSEEIAQMDKVFCTQCGGEMTSELGKLATSQKPAINAPEEKEMLLSRKATLAVAKKLAQHGVEASIEKLENNRFRVEAQAELPEALSQEIKDVINDVDSLEQALEETTETPTEEAPIMANKSKKAVKAQETPVEEIPTEETEIATDDSDADEEILDEAEAMNVSAALKSAGVKHTITKVAKNGYVVKAQEEVIEPPAAMDEASDDSDEDDMPTEESQDEEIPMTEKEAEMTSAQLKKAGVTHTVTRVKGGYIVRAQEDLTQSPTELPSDVDTAQDEELEPEATEESQYGVPPYTDNAQSEEVMPEAVAKAVSAQLTKAGVKHTMKKTKKGFVIAQETEEEPEATEEDAQEDDEDILTEEQATVASRQLKKACVAHTITRVAKNGYVIAQENPVIEESPVIEDAPEMANDDEDADDLEESQPEAVEPTEEPIFGKKLTQAVAEKASASLRKKGVKHSITRVSKTGYVLAQLDDCTEEGQYGVPPYTDKAQSEEPTEQSQVEETPVTETPADPQAEEAVIHEALSNIDDMSDVSVADLGMTLYDEELDNPHYNLDICGKPVAAIYLNDQPKPEELRSSFVKPEVYAKNFCAAVEKLGVKEVLVQTKARLWAAKVQKTKLAEQMTAKVEANLGGQYADKIAAFTGNFKHAFNVVIAGLNKNFFSELDNPLKMSLYASLKERGIDDAVEVIEDAFASSADKLFQVAVAKTEELLAKPKEVVDELARTIASVNPVRVGDNNAPSFTTLGRRLADNSMPVVAQHAPKRNMSREEVKANIKSKIKFGGTLG